MRLARPGESDPAAFGRLGSPSDLRETVFIAAVTGDRVPIVALLARTLKNPVATHFQQADGVTAVAVDGVAVVALLSGAGLELAVPAVRLAQTGRAASITVHDVRVVALLTRIEVAIATERKHAIGTTVARDVIAVITHLVSVFDSVTAVRGCAIVATVVVVVGAAVLVVGAAVVGAALVVVVPTVEDVVPTVLVLTGAASGSVSSSPSTRTTAARIASTSRAKITAATRGAGLIMASALRALGDQSIESQLGSLPLDALKPVLALEQRQAGAVGPPEHVDALHRA